MLATLRSAGSFLTEAATEIFRVTPNGIVSLIVNLSFSLRIAGAVKGGEPEREFPEEYRKELLAKVKKEPQENLDKIDQELIRLRQAAVFRGGVCYPPKPEDNLLVLAYKTCSLRAADLLITAHCPYLDNPFVPLAFQAARNPSHLDPLTKALAEKLYAGDRVVLPDLNWKQQVVEQICQMKGATLAQTASLLNSAVKSARAQQSGTYTAPCENEALAEFLASRCEIGNPLDDHSCVRISHVAHGLLHESEQTLAAASLAKEGTKPPKKNIVVEVLSTTPRGAAGDFKFMEDF